MHRELFEETGIQVKFISKIETIPYSDGKYNYLLHDYTAH